MEERGKCYLCKKPFEDGDIVRLGNFRLYHAFPAGYRLESLDCFWSGAMEKGYLCQSSEGVFYRGFVRDFKEAELLIKSGELQVREEKGRLKLVGCLEKMVCRIPRVTAHVLQSQLQDTYPEGL